MDQTLIVDLNFLQNVNFNKSCNKFSGLWVWCTYICPIICLYRCL